MEQRKKFYEAALKSDNQSAAAVVVTKDATSEGLQSVELVNQQ